MNPKADNRVQCSKHTVYVMTIHGKWGLAQYIAIWEIAFEFRTFAKSHTFSLECHWVHSLSHVRGCALSNIHYRSCFGEFGDHVFLAQGLSACFATLVGSEVSSEKEVLTACTFLLNNFLLKRASEGAPFWCNILVYNCSLVRHGRKQRASSHVKELTAPTFFWQEHAVTVCCIRLFITRTCVLAGGGLRHCHNTDKHWLMIGIELWLFLRSTL